MRIERISENSIRCTLSSFDLNVRNLNLKELAYGTDKARKLFDEMMTNAGNEVGFHVDNTPLMIEAIPMSSDSIQLIISKVEDPEELDMRFSRFTQNPSLKKTGTDWLSRFTSELLEGAAGLSKHLEKLDEAGLKNAGKILESLNTQIKSDRNEKDGGAKHADAAGEKQPAQPDYRAFAFDDLNSVINASRTAAPFAGVATLYKRPDSKRYILLIECKNTGQEDFSKTCNIVAEYGRMLRTVPESPAYYEEHYQVIVKDSAINSLAQI